jgi:dihydroorotate dehydrogenase electron transfer subunit
METRIHAVRLVRELSGGSCVLEVDGPIPETRAGQFYMLRTAVRWPVLVPRPFSLYGRYEGGARGTFLIKTVGPGTRALSQCRPGDEIWLTGPLGSPFPADVEDPVCVAGGVGLAPFLLLAQEHCEQGRPPLRLLFGGRDRASLAGMEDLEDLARLWTSTDDGCHGRHGLVTQLLQDLLEQGELSADDTVFCCGPDPMMHAVARLCRGRAMRCYLSLENYMGCGYGVCNGCSVEVVPERNGGWPYSRSCQDGPVYDARDLVLDGPER